jgi:hypothetical protein
MPRPLRVMASGLRVLLHPPCPARVSKRTSPARSFSRSATSCSRPTKLVNCSGRLFCGGSPIHARAGSLSTGPAFLLRPHEGHASHPASDLAPNVSCRLSGTINASRHSQRDRVPNSNERIAPDTQFGRSLVVEPTEIMPQWIPAFVGMTRNEVAMTDVLMLGARRSTCARPGCTTRN